MLPPAPGERVSDSDDQKPSIGGRPDRDSEMFSVRDARKTIPPIRDVPLTKEEIARRKRNRTLVAISIVVAVVVAAVALYKIDHRRQIDAARAEAERTGRTADIQRAIDLLEGENAAADVALAARLHATLELAGETGHRESAEQLLAHHDASGDGASDHRIAESYLALAAGDAEGAARGASLLVAGRGPRAAEAGLARALAALAIGNLEEARSAADAALTELPTAPRHRALVVVIAARAGDEAPDATGDEAVLALARARAALERGDATSDIRAGADATLAASDATPAERAWATLLLGLADGLDGDTLAAATHLEAANATPPPGDELFRIELAEGFFAIGRRLDADAAMESLTSPVSTDASRRALLTARRAIVRGDGEAAARAAEGAADSPRRTLVLAEIAALRGDSQRARTLFERAAETSALRTFALPQLSALLLREGETQAALTVIEPALAESPTHPRLAAAAAYALAANGDRDGALTAVSRALEAHDGEPTLLVANARLHARAAEWEAAYESFHAAADATRTDPQISTERGQAARALGHLDEAREAYAAALAVDPSQGTALVALLGIQLETHDVDGARESIARIDAGHLVSPEIDHMRAEYLVERRAGESGVHSVEEAIGRDPSDGELRLALARLYYQAERWSDAADAFYAALSRTSDRNLALGMRAIALARGRRAPTVEAMLDQIRGSATDAPLTPRDQALMSVASAWVQWHDEAYGRASIFARQALDAVPDDRDATLLLAYLDENAHRDPTPHLLPIRDRSIEARGWLATLGEMDAGKCVDARGYLEAAPEGRFAEALRARAATCH
jgi:tetratricopeptide (TPR) repeat protein